MTSESEALDYMRTHNTDGTYDNVLSDFEAGKITVALLKFQAASVDHLKQNNILGRYDDLIAKAEAYRDNPVVVVQPKKA